MATSEPHARLPSIRALMTKFDISQATVTSALNRLEGQGVLYRRQGSGIFVSPDRSTRPILVLANSDIVQSPSGFWEVLLRNIRLRYADAPERIELRYTNSGVFSSHQLEPGRQISDGLLENLRAGAFSGLYLICVSVGLMKLIRECDIPHVGFACPARYDIHMAWLEACQMGVGALAKLGCKRIAQYNPSHAATREVFLAALRTHQISERPVSREEACGAPDTPFGFHTLVQNGFRSAMLAFGPDSNPSNRPDGVISLDDMFTQGYLMGLQVSGVELGGDVQVATQTNYESPSLLAWQDRIVRMEFRVAEIAETMHAALEALIQKQEPSNRWEHATWATGEEGPSRLAMISPQLIMPKQ